MAGSSKLEQYKDDIFASIGKLVKHKTITQDKELKRLTRELADDFTSYARLVSQELDKTGSRAEKISGQKAKIKKLERENAQLASKNKNLQKKLKSMRVDLGHKQESSDGLSSEKLDLQEKLSITERKLEQTKSQLKILEANFKNIQDGSGESNAESRPEEQEEESLEVAYKSESSKLEKLFDFETDKKLFMGSRSRALLAKSAIQTDRLS